MLKILVAVGVVVAVKAALAQGSCLDEDVFTLRPSPVREEDRAYNWAKTCVAIAKLKKGVGAPGLASCAPDINVAIEFCAKPLTASKRPGYAELVSAAKELTSKECEPRTTRVSVQSVEALLGTPFQDDLVRGLAQFVVSRAKAEALAWAIERLKDHLCASADARRVLPATCELVEDADPYGDAPVAWGTLKVAFETDFERLPERAVACILDQSNADKGVTTLAVAGVQAARLIREGDDPIAVFSGLAEHYAVTRCTEAEGTAANAAKAECALHLLGFLTRLLSPELDGSDGSVLSPSDMTLFIELAVRLLSDHLGGAEVIGSPALVRLYDVLVRLADRVARARKALASLGEDADRFQSVVRLATAFVDVGEAALDLAPDARAIDSKLARKALIAIRLFTQAVDAAVERNYGRVFVYVAQAIRKLDVTVPSWLVKYGPFVAEVASAKTPEDVQRALETAAAPVGASRAKRLKGRRTIALNAFVGGQLGAEHVTGSELSVQGGIFAPVGIDASIGLGGDSIRWSAGLFLSVIDLGALASFRESTTTDAVVGEMGETATVQSAPEIGLKQVFSPGLYIVFGAGPFAFGAGASVTAELRRIEAGGKLIERETALRFGAFLAIDVTIFPF